MSERIFQHPRTLETYRWINGEWFKERGIYLDPCREPKGVQEVVAA